MSNLKLLMASQKSGSGVSTPTDSNFKYVAALLHGNGSNTSANNTSTAVTIPPFSRNGNSAEGTFTPYGSNWSNLFDGSTGYLSYAAGSSGSVGSNNFTAEAWINLNALPANTGTAGSVAIIQKGYAGGSNLEFNFYIEQTSGVFQFFVQMTTDGSTIQTFTSSSLGTVTVGTWYHCAITKSGTTLTFWFNGTSVGTATVPATLFIGTAPYTIAANTVGGTPLLSGSISNARVVSGTVVYTANFTPSTSPLTAISGTKLLVACGNTFADASSLNSAVTVNGTVKVQRYNPFGDNNTPYSTSTYGGSCWFDGSTSYFTVPSSTNYQFTGDFTMEAWVYPTTTGSNCYLGYWTFGTSTSCAFLFQSTSSGFLTLNYGIGSSNLTFTGTSAKVIPNAWNHIAVTRQGTTMRFFVNGVQDATTATASGAFNNATQPLFIGANNNVSGFSVQAFYSGYMTDVRIVNGTALYTASFTPNTTALTSVTNTTLLYNAQTAGKSGIYDSAMYSDICTIGTVQISTAQSKFGGSSIYFSGTLTNSVYPTLLTPGSGYQLGNNNFTIEAWIYPTSASQTAQIAGSAKNGTNSDWFFYLNAGKLAFHWNNSSDLTSTSSPAANAWSHVAVVRSGGNLYLYLNGSQVGTTTVSGSIGSNTGDNFTIGSDTTTASMPYAGYMDEIRITMGYARYTGSTYTTPTAAFPSSISGDSQFNYVTLLLHGDGSNAATNKTSVATIPSSNVSLTRSGTLTEGTFTPYGSNWSTFLSSTSTSSYLTYGASTSAGPGNQTFTIECWAMFDVLPTTTGSAGEFVLWQKGRTGTSNFELALGVQYTGSAYQILVQVSKGDGITIASANSSNISLTVGTWNHFAITQVGGSGTINFWFNGQSGGSMSTTVTNMFVGTGAAAIGNNNTGTNPTWQGYISNMRVVFGSQVYTSTFTPPTSPLTAITGTNFLGCQSSIYVDNSSNNWAITASGPMQIVRFNPFGDNATPYSTTTYGGSCYFAGSGSNLSYASSSNAGFGTGAFTIEAWIYLLSYCSNGGAIVDLRPSVSATATEISIDSTGKLFYYDGPNNTTYSDTTAMPLNAWFHVALTRDASGVWRLFKNGTQVQTSTASDNLGSSQPIMIGQSINGTTSYFNGYISDLRICNGSALYTANFTPNTTPLAATTATNFIYKAQGANIYDNAMQQNVQTSGSAAISTAQQKFGTGSINIAGGTSNFLSIPNSEVPIWGTSSWTIEGWFYITSYSTSASDGLFGFRNGVNYGAMSLVLNNGTLQALASTSSSSWTFNQSASGTFTTNAWVHLAMVRNGTTLTVYQNGTSVISGTISGSLYQPTVPFTIGSSNNTNGSGNNCMTGYIQDFRITYGLARYTTNFTVPTTAFPNQ
jgi:hypothetical protein